MRAMLNGSVIGADMNLALREDLERSTLLFHFLFFSSARKKG